MNRFPSFVDPTFPASPFAKIYSPSFILEGEEEVGGNEDDLDWKFEWTSHLVLFSTLLDFRDPGDGQESVGELLHRRGYRVKERIWNSLVHESKRSGEVIILEWTK